MDYELNKTEFRALSSIFEGNETNKKLSEAIGRSTTRTSAIVNGLKEKGFVDVKRKGMSNFIGFSNNSFIQPLKRLVMDQFPLSECLSDTDMTLLSYFIDGKSNLDKKDILLKTDLAEVTIRKFLSRQIRYGILKKESNGYRLSSSQDNIRDLIVEYSQFTSSRFTENISTDSVIHWRNNFEFIYSIGGERSNSIGFKTALTAFKEEGIDFMSNRTYFHYIPKRNDISREEYILDNIVSHKYNKRSILYSAIYFKVNEDRVDSRRLIDLSSLYGDETIARKLILYVEDNINIGGFPDIDDFHEKLKIYQG